MASTLKIVQIKWYVFGSQVYIGTDPVQPENGWPKRDGFHWSNDQLQWFVNKGCEWVKPVMEPGDFVLWDSRCVHYGATPLDDKKRFAICKSLPLHVLSSYSTDICYKPDGYMSEEQRERKVEAFKRGYCTVSLPLKSL